MFMVEFISSNLRYFRSDLLVQISPTETVAALWDNSSPPKVEV